MQQTIRAFHFEGGIMPLRYGTAALTNPNPCLECGVHCRKGKRFCSDDHKEQWLSSKIARSYPQPPGTPSLDEQRRALGITPSALEFHRKLSLSRPF
jgi:hypothetical protein